MLQPLRRTVPSLSGLPGPHLPAAASHAQSVPEATLALHVSAVTYVDSQVLARARSSRAASERSSMPAAQEVRFIMARAARHRRGRRH